MVINIINCTVSELVGQRKATVDDLYSCVWYVKKQLSSQSTAWEDSAQHNTLNQKSGDDL